jgi:hypothetical protein
LIRSQSSRDLEKEINFITNALKETLMSSRIVFTSRKPKIVVLGSLLFTGAILACAVLFSLSPVEAKVKDESRTAVTQPEPPLTPGVQAASTVFLPLIAHESINHMAAHEGAPPSLAMASSDHTGHSTTPPPAANRHTFVANEGGHLDGYWGRSDLPNGQLTFIITTTAPMVPGDQYYNPWNGWLTPAGLEYMRSRHLLSDFSLLEMHVWDVDHDASGCAEVDYVFVNGQQITDKNGAPVVLRSGNNEWATWSVFIPTLFLRFPIRQIDGVVQPAINEIDIDVNTQQCESNDCRTYASSIVTEGDFNC